MKSSTGLTFEGLSKFYALGKEYEFPQVHSFITYILSESVHQIHLDTKLRLRGSVGHINLVTENSEGNIGQLLLGKQLLSMLYFKRKHTLSSFLASGKRSLSSASTMKIMPSTLAKYCFQSFLATNDESATFTYRTRDHRGRRF